MGAVIEDLAAVAGLRPVQDAEQGGFAGAGGADDGEKFPVLQCKADVPQHLPGALELLADVADLQHGTVSSSGVYSSMDFKRAWASRSPS